MPQKYTSSQHGNKCLKEEIRSVTKVGFVSKDKASLVRKDTTGHVKKISPGGSGFSRPSATAQVFLNEREYNTLFSLPPFPAQNLPSASKNRGTPHPPPPTPPPLVLSEPQSEPIQTWRQTLRNSARQNTSSGRKTMNNGHHF